MLCGQTAHIHSQCGCGGSARAQTHQSLGQSTEKCTTQQFKPQQATHLPGSCCPAAPQHPCRQPDGGGRHVGRTRHQRCTLVPVVGPPRCLLVLLAAVVRKPRPRAAQQLLCCAGHTWLGRLEAPVTAQGHLVIVENGCVWLLLHHTLSCLQVMCSY